MNDDERAGNGVTMEEEEQEGEGMEEQEHEGMEEPVRDMDNDDDYLPNFGEEEQEDAPAEELPTQNHDYGNHEDDDDDDEDNEEEDNDNEEEHDNDDIRKDDDDDDDDDEEVKPEETETADPNGSKESPEEQNTTVGGTHPKEALCIFDGLVEQNDDDGAPKLISEWERVTLLIKRLPATIGRAHVTSDKNFVSLGAGHHHHPSPKNHPPPGGKKPPHHHKSVSRQHVRIDYRVPSAAGGCGHVQTKVGYRSEFFYNHTDDPLATSAIRILPLPPPNSTAALVDTHDNNAELLPATGFFTLTCLGKNRVLVNGTRIEANETVWLRSGTAIRIANYLLYFLTPLQQEGGGAKRTIQIRDDIAPVHNNKQRKLSLGVSTARPALIGSGTGEGIAVDDDDDNVDEKNHSFRGAASRSMQSEIESLSTDKLLLEMKTAQEADVWDRRHQLIGATLSYRAVRDAAHDTEWYEREGGTVSRSAVMEWVASSDKFGAWVEHMLSKLEPKSYQASITKGMIKAGYIRTTSSGRYIKWIVPRTTDHKAQASAVARNDLNESNHSIGQESLPSDE